MPRGEMGAGGECQPSAGTEASPVGAGIRLCVAGSQGEEGEGLLREAWVITVQKE